MTDKIMRYIAGSIIIAGVISLMLIIEKQHRQIVYYESYYQDVLKCDSTINSDYDKIIVELDKMTLVYDSIIEKQKNK